MLDQPLRFNYNACLIDRKRTLHATSLKCLSQLQSDTGSIPINTWWLFMMLEF